MNNRINTVSDLIMSYMSTRPSIDQHDDAKVW